MELTRNQTQLNKTEAEVERLQAELKKAMSGSEEHELAFVDMITANTGLDAQVIALTEVSFQSLLLSASIICPPCPPRGSCPMHCAYQNIILCRLHDACAYYVVRVVQFVVR